MIYFNIIYQVGEKTVNVMQSEKGGRRVPFEFA